MIYGIDYTTRTMFGVNREPEPPEALHCGGCDQVVAELEPCTWDARLQVGPCCRVHPDQEFALTSPAELPRLEPIAARPVALTAPEYAPRPMRYYVWAFEPPKEVA